MDNNYNQTHNLRKLVVLINQYGGDNEDGLAVVTKNHILTNYIHLISSSLDVDKFIQIIMSTGVDNTNNQGCVVVERKLDDSGLVMMNYCWGMHMYSYNLFNSRKVQCACMLDSSPVCGCNYQLYHHYFCINPFHYVSNAKRECDGSFIKFKTSKLNSNEYLSLDRFFSYRVPNYTLVPMDGDSNSTEYMLKSNDSPDNLKSWICVTYYEGENSLIYNKKYHQSSIQIVCDKDHLTTNYPNTLNLSTVCSPLQDQQVSICKNLIKNGISIDRKLSMVYITLCAPIAIFVRVPFINYIEGKHPMYITRILHQTPFKVFDLDKFKEIVDHKCNTQNYEDVLNLASFGSLEVSFVKGWGENYKRQKVNETPCWLQFRIIESLDYLDFKLKNMNGPHGICPSTT